MTDTGGETRNVIKGGTQYGPVLMGRDFRHVHIGDVVQAIPAPVALAQLPALVTEFTGRDAELAEITELLDPAGNTGAVVVSAVAGLAGVGKTALAIQAAHTARQAGWFPGGIVFIDLHGYGDAPVQQGQALDALLRALGVAAEHIPPTTEERAALYRSELAKISDPVLILADNASTEAQVRPLLPGPGPHRVVVTSRHTLAGLPARLLDVTVLDDEAALALLEAALRHARPGDDRIGADQPGATRLARICGRLPLALQITAAMLKADPSLTVSDLADELGDEIRRLAALHYDDGSGTSAPSVVAAFELSYRQLDVTTARVFRLLPVNPGPDVSTAAAAVLADLPVGEVRQVIGQLVRAHLVEAAAGAAGRWRMHDLLYLYAGQLSDAHAEADGREQACDRLLDYYLDTATAADAHLHALPRTPVPAAFTGRDDALAWLDAQRTSLVTAVTMAASTGRDEIAIWLPLSLVQYLAWRRRFDDRLSVCMISRDTARRRGDRELEAATLNNLGKALDDLRRFEEAITALQDAATIFRETGNRHTESMALANLGDALRQVRRFEEAITALEDATAICRETGDRNGEGSALTSLGLALRDLRRFEEAVTAHQGAAAIFRETGDRHGEGNALTNLGDALREVRRFKGAITALRAATALYQETGDRHGEGIALTNLGLTLLDVRRPEQAITALRAAAAIFRETSDRHGEGNALMDLGLALQDLGLALQDVDRFEEAITAHQDAAAIFRETGDRHGEGDALTNLGDALRYVDRSEEAITAHQDAAAIFRETGDRYSEGGALTSLGSALLDVGRFEEAIITLQDAAAILRETGDQQREGLALDSLGHALREVGRFEEAITAHRDAAAIFRETDDQQRKGLALLGLGEALRAAGRFEEAIIVDRDATAFFRNTFD
jgi:tetratricopeptide (TPR) repeat protein